MLSPGARSAIVVALTAAALAASAALLVDYAGQAPVFCSEGGGCDALRQTAFGHPLGVPLPLIGAGGFLLLGMLAVTRGPRVRTANVVIAGLAGFVGAALLLVQVLVGHLCPYCLVVDLSSMGLAAMAVDRQRSAWDPPRGGAASLAMSFALAAALAAPFAWAAHLSNRIPPVVAAELAKSPLGAVTIVDFVDFECPFCRTMQGRLAPLIAGKDDVRVVRKLVPLTRIHPHALAAAKAACCGEELGKGEAMAEALFETKVDDLTPDGCAAVAARLGLPMDRYRACVDSPETDARLARDRQDFDRTAVKGDGLPLMWVGRRKLMGVRDTAVLADAIEQARARAGS